MRPPRILVADDESNIRLMLRTTLSTEGYDLLEARDGRQAIEVIEKESPDLLLLDLNMPVLDGMAVLEHLRGAAVEHRPAIIVLTAYGSIPAAVKATRLGAADFLEKPVTPDDLRQSVKNVLHDLAAAQPIRSAADDEGYEAVLDRVRTALRMENVASAESLLMRAADVGQQNSAPYFNLLGVLYETQRSWRLAKKFYGKAIRADGSYEPARQNMRRWYELDTFGRTSIPITLGDEPQYTIGTLAHW